MSSVDDIFKQSGFGAKRKLEAIKDPNEIYNANKRSATGTSTRRVGIEDELAPTDQEEPSDGDDDEDFGPAMPTGDEEDDGDDAEGRFFGGGITKQESQILDFVDEADDGKAQETIDGAWLRRTVLNFEKRITKNAELRAKFENDPEKFISSEADLDADIKGLSILSEYPELYPDFVKLGSVDSLAGLLAHENTDIAIDAIELIGELTDEDVAADEDHFNSLADALIDADLIDLLTSNFSRLDEKDESDRNGVYHALGVLENLCSRTTIATRICKEDRLIQWLMQRIQQKETPVTQNKQYAAEILAILAQASTQNRIKLATNDNIDVLLQLMSPYRRRDPERGSEEEEFIENVFETITCIVDEGAGKDIFTEAEGTELCLIIAKEGKFARPAALRLLDHASSGDNGVIVCLRLVESGGLKTLFTIFMKTQDNRLMEHLLVIFANMLRFLPGDSPERIRTLAKFVEKNYEKTKRLMDFRRDYSSRVMRADKAFKQERQSDADDMFEVELLSRKLESGLFTLQLLDTILAWLAAEDKGAKQQIKVLLAERDETLDSIATTLREQLDTMDANEEDTKDTRDMLRTLIDVL